MVDFLDQNLPDLPANPEDSGPTGSAPTDRGGVIGARGVIVAVVVAGVTAVVCAKWWTGMDAGAMDGLPESGMLTVIGLPITQYISVLAGVAVAGVLFLRCLTLDPSAGPSHRHMARMAARWAYVMMVATAGWIVFTVSDLVGTPVTGLVAHPELLVRSLGTTRVLAEMATLSVAILVALFATMTSGRIADGLLMLVAAAALLPSALTGHVSHHNSPVLSTIALGVHILAAAIWVGGLLALIVHLRSFPDQLRLAVGRFSAAALICVAAVGVSGLVVSVVMLDGVQMLVGTGRGQLILAKTAALIALIYIGYQHRRRTVDTAANGRLAPLLRLGAGELALMGATIGIAVVLSTTG